MAAATAFAAMLPSPGWAQVAGLSPLPVERPVVSSDTGGARDVLARVRPAVIQIKGFFGLNTAQAFHGTGFAVSPGGVFMTNYHVVSAHVQYPGKYRLEYRTPDGKTGPVEVLAIDVRHDLAVVRAEGYAPEPLELEPIAPAKGDRAYSVGFPLDVGLTITEGVSNGKVEDSFDPRIHYSGALNSGMSGGPALNAAGKVIGVNVSGYLFQQSVAFLVPAEHALSLRNSAPAVKPDPEALRTAIQEQMRAHSRELLAGLADPMPTQSVAGYTLPAKLAPFVDCNASGNPTSDEPVTRVQINCLAKAGLYLQQGLTTGDIRYSHFVLQTAKLDAWRFTARLSTLTHATGQRGSRRHVGRFACQDRIVALKGFDASLLVCTRGYRKYDGLYDFVVRVSSLNGATRGFASHLDMFGLEFDAGMAFVRRYVEAMEWKP